VKTLGLILLFVISNIITFSVTFDMTQEIIGALWIEKEIENHRVHKALVKSVNKGDMLEIKDTSNKLLAHYQDMVKILVRDLDKGHYKYFTNEEIEKGKEYLQSIEQTRIGSN